MGRVAEHDEVRANLLLRLDQRQWIQVPRTDLAQRATQRLKTRWPMEDMLGADLATAAQRRIAAQCDRPVTLDAIDGSLWLKVDSYTLLQALTYLAHRLVDEFEVRFLQLRLQSTGTHAQLDLVWSGQAMSNETVMNWEMDAMRFGAERSPLTVREVVERHGGEMWFERERVRHQAFFRFMLPLASVQGVVDAALGESEYSRPEYYDFDLFKQADQGSALDDRPLSELAYTVFDTETTGLNPAGGDAIIQLGAARIVNGKLLRQECFEQLVDPGRGIPAASIPIHGITDDFLQDKPKYAEIADTLFAYLKGAEIIAHNATFDMNFLDMEFKRAGLPLLSEVCEVTDTLALAKNKHPGQKNSLDALVRRYEIPARDRTFHGALLDAEILADVYLAMTGGQVSFDIDALSQTEQGQNKNTRQRVQIELPVIYASGDELAQHETWVKQFEQKHGKPCFFAK